MLPYNQQIPLLPIRSLVCRASALQIVVLTLDRLTQGLLFDFDLFCNVDNSERQSGLAVPLMPLLECDRAFDNHQNAGTGAEAPKKKGDEGFALITETGFELSGTAKFDFKIVCDHIREASRHGRVRDRRAAQQVRAG